MVHPIQKLRSSAQRIGGRKTNLHSKDSKQVNHTTIRRSYSLSASRPAVADLRRSRPLHIKRHFILAFAIANLSPAYSQAPASSSNTVIAWGKPLDGLKVGISCDTTTSDLRRPPKIFFHIANDGDKEIQGIILSATKCIVTVNGQHYAQEFFGGKGSRMPPRTFLVIGHIFVRNLDTL